MLNTQSFAIWQTYSPNTRSTVVRNLTVLSSSTYKKNHISNHFWDKSRYEDVVNLCEIQQISKLNINSLKINVNDNVVVYDEKVSGHFWRIAIVTEVLPSRDSRIRGAIVRIARIWREATVIDELKRNMNVNCVNIGKG